MGLSRDHAPGIKEGAIEGLTKVPYLPFIGLTSAAYATFHRVSRILCRDAL